MLKNSKRQVKKIPKRTTLLQKLAYILRPFVLYMLVKTAAMLFLAIAIPALPITGIAAWVERNAHPLSAAVNGVASLAAVCFLLNDFLIEASTTGEVDIDKGIFGQMRFCQDGFIGNQNKTEGSPPWAVYPSWNHGLPRAEYHGGAGSVRIGEQDTLF